MHWLEKDQKSYEVDKPWALLGVGGMMIRTYCQELS